MVQESRGGANRSGPPDEKDRTNIKKKVYSLDKKKGSPVADPSY